MNRDLHLDGRGRDTKLELSIDVSVDVALWVNYSQDFDLNVDLHLVDVDDVDPHTIKLSDAKHCASLLFNFLLKSLHSGVNKIISLQKLIGNLDKMTIC